MSMSVVILNWKRPDNLARIVIDLQRSGLTDDLLVWNNNSASPLKLEQASVINASRDMGLYTRFAAACLARHEAVLIQDDDLVVPLDSLRYLYNAWMREPDILHGIFGRAAKPDGSYARDIRGDSEAPIILTRALIAHRSHAAQFFVHLPEFMHLLQMGCPVGNGEDIVFSYVARRTAGRLHRVHRLTVEELPAPDPIHGRHWLRHVAHRTAVMQAAETWLAAKGACPS